MPPVGEGIDQRVPLIIVIEEPAASGSERILLAVCASEKSVAARFCPLSPALDMAFTRCFLRGRGGRGQRLPTCLMHTFRLAEVRVVAGGDLAPV